MMDEMFWEMLSKQECETAMLEVKCRLFWVKWNVACFESSESQERESLHVCIIYNYMHVHMIERVHMCVVL